MPVTKKQLDKEFNALGAKLRAELTRNKIDDSKCPLCDDPATHELRDHHNIKFYHCEKCSDFFISRNAAAHLQKEPHRKAFFAQAAASHKGKELIFALTLKAGGVLHPETIPRTSYPK